MKIATVLFTYNRSWHTKTVLDALEKNEMKPQKLFIFQDGMKASTNLEEWKAVNALITAVSWCDTAVVVSRNNKGLAKSIIDGMDYVFEAYEAAIVLEDDCVPHPMFMSFMTDALNQYARSRQVYNVTGYAYPVNLDKQGADAYFCGRSSSWGWGTWKDRWREYERDYGLLKRIKKDIHMNNRLQIWGADLQNYLIGNVTGGCDSWAVFWALKIIEKNGCCLTPYESLITNIGLDGSGVHCGTEEFSSLCRPIDNMQKYILPIDIQISEKSELAYKKLLAVDPRKNRLKCYYDVLAKWVMAYQKNQVVADVIIKREITCIAIWGKGKICDLLLEEFKNRIKISSIIESDPIAKEYKGFPLIPIEKVEGSIQAIIVIPIYDMDKIKEKINSVNSAVKVIGINELFVHNQVTNYFGGT